MSYTQTTATPPVASLRRPQTSPRSPLTSVRNIVAAWKERTPALGSDKNKNGTAAVSAPSPLAEGDSSEGLFSLRKRAERGEARLREQITGSMYETPRRSSGSGGSGGAVVPPPFDMAELSGFARGSQEVSKR
jgi:hypothetical protein